MKYLFTPPTKELAPDLNQQSLHSSLLSSCSYAASGVVTAMKSKITIACRN